MSTDFEMEAALAITCLQSVHRWMKKELEELEKTDDEDRLREAYTRFCALRDAMLLVARQADERKRLEQLHADA